MMFGQHFLCCAFQDVERFIFVRFEEGKDKCPYDPAKGYTGFIVGKEYIMHGHPAP